MSKHRAVALLLTIFAALPATVAEAHALDPSFEVQVGEYLVDIGYEPDPLTSETYARFSFELWLNERGNPVEYSHVWVRIMRDSTTLFASGIHRQAVGPTTLLYTFPDAGAYVLDISYRTEDSEVAATEIPITVTRGADGNRSVFAVSIVAFCALLAAAALSAWRGAWRTPFRFWQRRDLDQGDISR